MARTQQRRPTPWRAYAFFLALVAPNFALVGVFGYWPVIDNAMLSFQQWDMISPWREFVGLSNWADFFTGSLFGEMMWQTCVLMVGVTVGSLALGLGIAVLLDQHVVGRIFGRTLAFAPYVVGSATTAMIWLFLFDPNFGLIKQVLAMAGLPAPAWMSDAHWTMPGLIVVHIWRHAGFVAVIYIAGLQAIPRDLIEAAAIDGAGAWRRFRHVSLPLLLPVTAFLLITTVISTFQAFDLIQIMTQGGPGTSTVVLSYHIYEMAFVRNDAGAAGTAATFMFLLLVGITAIQARFLGRTASPA